jgi:hypothetical protein
LKKGEKDKMEAKKIAAIAVDISAGFIVALMGLEMLPFPLDIIWGIFNVWLWIVSPALILWAKNKDANNLLN